MHRLARHVVVDERLGQPLGERRSAGRGPAGARRASASAGPPRPSATQAARRPTSSQVPSTSSPPGARPPREHPPGVGRRLLLVLAQHVERAHDDRPQPRQLEPAAREAQPVGLGRPAPPRPAPGRSPARRPARRAAPRAAARAARPRSPGSRRSPGRRPAGRAHARSRSPWTATASGRRGAAGSGPSCRAVGRPSARARPAAYRPGPGHVRSAGAPCAPRLLLRRQLHQVDVDVRRPRGDPGDRARRRPRRSARRRPRRPPPPARASPSNRTSENSSVCTMPGATSLTRTGRSTTSMPQRLAQRGEPVLGRDVAAAALVGPAAGGRAGQHDLAGAAGDAAAGSSACTVRTRPRTLTSYVRRPGVDVGRLHRRQVERAAGVGDEQRAVGHRVGELLDRARVGDVEGLRADARGLRGELAEAVEPAGGGDDLPAVRGQPRAVAAPMPLLAPVTTAVRAARGCSCREACRRAPRVAPGAGAGRPEQARRPSPPRA